MKRAICGIVLVALYQLTPGCVDPIELYAGASVAALSFLTFNSEFCPEARVESEEVDIPGYGKMIVLKSYDRYVDPVGINNHGRAALVTAIPLALFAACDEAFLFDGDFHTLEKPRGTVSFAYGISDTGLVIGLIQSPGVFDDFVVWENGAPTTLPSAGEYVRPDAISGQGIIAGRIFEGGRSRLARWEQIDGAWQLADLGGPGDYHEPYALNDRGQIIGSVGYGLRSAEVQPRYESFLWENGVFQTPPIGANDINDAGWMVGSVRVPVSHPDRTTDGHAALWKDGEIIDLGTLGDTRSWADAINERGQVVGRSWFSLAPNRAFLWENGVMRDLNDLAPPGHVSTITKALAINDAGVILCIAEKGEAVVFVPAD